MLQNREDQLVKEFPFVLEKLGEERSGYFCLVFRQNGAEEAEDPIASVHFRLDTVFFEVLGECRKMLLNKHLYDIAVLLQTWKANLIYIS